ncbi:hypothetical protein HMPREF9413_4089 [Paenibacillus sp. HGF7]|nr:hypothetical protein HMPREF9413_4089 [Paenibacillus sp. HGF7]
MDEIIPSKGFCNKRFLRLNLKLFLLPSFVGIPFASSSYKIT